MLPIIDRFLVVPFLLPFGTLVGVLLAVRFATSSVSAHVDGLLFGLLLVTLTAGLIVFGGLVRSSEILALRASGASLIRIVRAPTLLALLVTVGFVTFIRIETDALGWWRIVAEAAAVPLAMIVALPLAVAGLNERSRRELQIGDDALDEFRDVFGAAFRNREDLLVCCRRSIQDVRNQAECGNVATERACGDRLEDGRHSDGVSTELAQGFCFGLRFV